MRNFYFHFSASCCLRDIDKSGNGAEIILQKIEKPETNKITNNRQQGYLMTNHGAEKDMSYPNKTKGENNGVKNKNATEKTYIQNWRIATWNTRGISRKTL